MITAKWCNQELNASAISWSNVKSELVEVFESRSIAELKDEISDVLYFTYCILESKLGINLPMYGAASTIMKVMDRLEIWKMIFTNHNLVFNKKYLINGSNFARSEKIEKALQLARNEQRK